jgi:ribosomal protein S16
VEYWLGKGAQPSDTVRGILKRHKSAAETATAATA